MKKSSVSKIILASSSPRRRQLLETIGINFSVKKIPVDEIMRGKNLVEAILQIAETKVRTAAENETDGIIIGADTVILLDGKVIGKPKDAADALRILKKLNGKSHRVVTGLVLYEVQSGKIRREAVTSEVSFLLVPEKTLRSYINDFRPLDKAGAYAIQEAALFWVREIKGSVTNVLGLPLETLVKQLASFGAIK